MKNNTPTVKKKTRRSLGNKPIKLTMYYCNVNGFQSKKDSVRLAVEQLKPDIIALCETKLSTGRSVKTMFPEYEVSTKPTKVGKSGLALCVKKDRFQTVLEATTSSLEDILMVRAKMGNSAIRFILGYAPQETADGDLRENFFSELEVEIAKSKMAEEDHIVIGDMNSKIDEVDNKLVHKSDNGKLLLQVIQNQDLQVLNFHSKCIGKWTHVIRTTGAASVLDYIMTSENLTNKLQEITIDEDCLFCPFWVKKKKQQFSDHNAIIPKFRIKYRKLKKIHRPRRWKLTKEGMERFHEITSAPNFATTIPNGTTQEQYDYVEDRMNSVMKECFRKAKSRKREDSDLSGNPLDKYKKIRLFSQKGKSQRKIARLFIAELKKVNIQKVANKVKDRVTNIAKQLTVDNKFSVDNFWKLCKNARKQITNNMSVETDDGNELFGEDMIRNAYRNEFIYRLRKREIAPELRNYEIRSEQICQLRLDQAKATAEEPYQMKELQVVKKKLKAGKASGRDLFPPEVYINCGDQLDRLLLNILDIMKSAQLAPDQWLQVQITTIYKNKGKKKLLINYRGIFLKQIISKMFEKMNMNRISPQMEKIDKFQAGSRNARGPPDQTFLLRATIDHSVYLRRALYLTLYDFSQCFDSLWLADCLLCLWKLGVTSETLNNIKKLNETCNFTVQTPVGLSEEACVQSIVQQGSVTGGALCAASTAEVTKEDLGNGCQVGNMNVKALTFVDDIASTTTKVADTYTSNRSIEWFSKKKRLGLNVPKCLNMCINRQATDILPRLKLAGCVIPTKEKGVYLGDQFNTKGNNQDLIEDRIKKGKACTITAISMCDDVTMGVYAVQTLLMLHHSLLIPVVLTNCCSWTKLSPANILLLQRVQTKYLKRTLHSPQSTPNAITFLETGVMPIEFEIHKRQLNYLHKVLTLDNDDPVKRMYNELLKYPCAQNWSNEIKTLRCKYNLLETDEEIESLNKGRWKRKVKKTIRQSALTFLNNEKKKLKKCALPEYPKLASQKYLQQLQPQHARPIFQIRAGVVDLKSVRKYQYKDTVCRLCNQADEDIEHVANICPKVSRSQSTIELPTNDTAQLKELAQRYLDFTNKVDDLNL